MLRCALCHEETTRELALTCGGCGTLLHRECREELRGCLTLGCAETPAVRPRTHAPVRTAVLPFEPGPRRRTLWVALGIVVPILAFVLDLSLRVNPLVWEVPQIVFDEASERTSPPNGARFPLVWGSALLSMAGLALFLWLPSSRLAAPLLWLGSAVALAHAIVFLPLLPLSLVGIFFMGVGLLGLSPFATTWVYFDALRFALEPAGPRHLRKVSVALGIALVALHWAALPRT